MRLLRRWREPLICAALPLVLLAAGPRSSSAVVCDSCVTLVDTCCAAIPHIVDPGFTMPTAVAIETREPRPNACVTLFDLSSTPPPNEDVNWTPMTRYNGPGGSWNYSNLGTVFGLTLDKYGNIFVTATSAYSTDFVGPGGPGAVYRISGTTGAITTFVQLPNSIPMVGLGNITYDCSHDQFFVTDLEDGRIYRIRAAGVNGPTGTVLDFFDPGAPDDGIAGYAPLGERLWGVQWHANRVYYSVWAEDFSAPFINPPVNSIRSVGLDGSGDFVWWSERHELDMPVYSPGVSGPVADISFGPTGNMLLAERTMTGETGLGNPFAHHSRLLEYECESGATAWRYANTFQVGAYDQQTNCAGGCDYDWSAYNGPQPPATASDGGLGGSSGRVWATGDAIHLGSPYTDVLYGLQALRPTGGSVLNSLLIDSDGDYGAQDKSFQGDVEIPCGNVSVFIPLVCDSCVIPPRCTVGWWPFDENSGNVCNDLASNYPGNWIGSQGWVAGKIGPSGGGFIPGRYVAVSGSAPQLNFGNGSFSIDAWIKPTYSTGRIVEKAFMVGGVGGILRGYELYMANGKLVLTIGDGVTPGIFTYTSSTPLNLGAWNFVSVSVCRGVPGSVTFYVNGLLAGPLSSQPLPTGSVSTGRSLWIGAGANFPGNPDVSAYTGAIDELEMMNCCVDTTTFGRIYRAGLAETGKCPEYCYISNQTLANQVGTIFNPPPVYPFLTICNNTSVTQNYHWSVTPCPPLTFNPSSGTATVLAHIILPIQLNGILPAGTPPGGCLCFTTTVTNDLSMRCFQCGGNVCRPVVIYPDIYIPQVVYVDHMYDYGFTLHNGDSTSTHVVRYRLRDVSSDGDATNAIARLNGLPPGTPVTGTFSLAPLDSVKVPFSVELDAFQPFTFHEIVLSADLDGDGNYRDIVGQPLVTLASPDTSSGVILDATQVKTGNDADGTTKIAISYTTPAGAAMVEVWRKGYGNYPLYDNGPGSGSVPPVPASYPPSGWTLTGVTASGQTDEPPTRDYWYYVAYAKSAGGDPSEVSNMTVGTLDYHLGDVSDGVTAGQGDNGVRTVDLSLLGAHYGLSGAALAGFEYLDVGPTSDLSTNGRPTTDSTTNFEDFVMFAINYTPQVSLVAKGSPETGAITRSAEAADVVSLSAPDRVSAGEVFDVAVELAGSGDLQAVSVSLRWNHASVEPVAVVPSDFVASQGGAVMSPGPGRADAALLGVGSHGLLGRGTMATVRFRAVAAGPAGISIGDVIGRDAMNRNVTVAIQKPAAIGDVVSTTELFPVVPNPAKRTSSVRYSLATRGAVDLSVYSVDGRRVKTLAHGVQESGRYQYIWDGGDDQGALVKSGVFFVRLEVAGTRMTRPIALIR